MFNSQSAKRFRAIFIALVITFATNYAISYASDGGQKLTPAEITSQSPSRSGNAVIPKPPVP